LLSKFDHLISPSQRLVRDLYKMLDQVNSEEIPVGQKLPQSFSEFVSDMKRNKYDAKTFAIRLKAMVCELHTSFLILVDTSFPDPN